MKLASCNVDEAYFVKGGQPYYAYPNPDSLTNEQSQRATLSSKESGVRKRRQAGLSL